MSLEDQGRHKDALDKYLEAADLFQEMLGSPNHLALFCQNKFASLLCRLGAYQRAGLFSRYVVALRAKTSGMKALQSLLGCCTLAECLTNQAKYQAAYAILQDALESTTFTTASMAAYTSLLSSLARVTFELGMASMAEFIAFECLRVSISLYGERHRFTLNRMIDLANYLLSNHMIVAQKLTHLAHVGLEEALGIPHPDSLRASQHLGYHLLSRGQLNDSSIRLRSTLDIQIKLLGPEHPDTLITMTSLGTAYTLQGCLKDAEALLKDALTGLERVLGADHRETRQTSSKLDILRRLKNNSQKPPIDDDEPKDPTPTSPTTPWPNFDPGSLQSLWATDRSEKVLHK